MRRGKKRFYSYEDYTAPSDSSTSESSDGGDYIPEPEFTPRPKRRKSSRSKSCDLSDDYYGDFDSYGFSESENGKGTKHKKAFNKTLNMAARTQNYIRSDVSIISQRNCLATQITPDDPACHQDPDGNPCRFIPFDELRPHLLNLEEILEPNEKGVNTLLHAYDPVAQNKLQFFQLDDSFVNFKYNQMEMLSLEELKEELEATEKDLEEIPVFPEYAKDFVIIPPYDEHINEAASIQTDVRLFDWQKLASIARFDVILMDPPWNIQPSQTTRGVELGYDLMPIEDIRNMPIEILQDNGYCFMWVVASALPDGVGILEKWGYKVVDFINWIKTSKYGRYKPANGYFLQHDKETCLVGIKGTPFDGADVDLFEDTIVCERCARQSHKPPTLYEIIERMFPGGLFLEIFARAHNLREGWVSIGLEVPE